MKTTAEILNLLKDYKIVASEGKCCIDVYINLANMTVDLELES